ncbi:MAG TPA: DAK2 domain-containing protein [Solirubrobacteraceae bacterium]|nr:DAK2 domain-containing protein [Solirubrobacteraceae bacterium]
MTDPNLIRFRTLVAGALAHLESRREEINDLNVFPVADGDTGDNMVLTLRAVLSELDRLAGAGDQTIDEIGRDEIVRSVARAALLGARGNSGVILSQLIHGAAEELFSRPGELIDPTLIGAALARAADRAYASVRAPAEGTILTVVREMASRVAVELAHMPETRLSALTTPQAQDDAIAGLLERAVAAGEASVMRTPDLLAVLRDAGVVDAGGYALVVIFAGIVAALRGDDPPALHHHAPARVTHPQHLSATFRYCTNFAVTGTGLQAGRFTEALEALGDSVLVVGDARTLKIHVHTDHPDQAIAVLAGAGEVSHLDVADMHAEVAARARRLAEGARCGVLAVVASAGIGNLFQSLGAHVLNGGPTLNPSTYELLAGIHAVAAEEVVVLPNSPNVIMAAERAAELSEKHVVVVPSRSQQTALASLVALSPQLGADENARAIAAALERVRGGSVAPAARDDADGRFSVGEAVGFVGETLVAWGEPEATLAHVLERLGDGSELITCIAGAGAPLSAERIEQLAPDAVELEHRHGGQPSYWWLLAAE